MAKEWYNCPHLCESADFDIIPTFISIPDVFASILTSTNTTDPCRRFSLTNVFPTHSPPTSVFHPLQPSWKRNSGLSMYQIFLLIPIRIGSLFTSMKVNGKSTYHTWIINPLGYWSLACFRVLQWLLGIFGAFTSATTADASETSFFEQPVWDWKIGSHHTIYNTLFQHPPGK